MIDKIIGELAELIRGQQDVFGDGYNTAITDCINIVRKYNIISETTLTETKKSKISVINKILKLIKRLRGNK